MAGSGVDKAVGFDPIAGPGARVLVLGSLPGRRSLETGQYYAHPRNAFWPIMRSLVNAEGSYERRCDCLVAARIAVWDVLHAAVRPGSLDSSISTKSMQTNDFHSFFAQHSALQCIGFNGAKARALFQRHVAPRLGADLPPTCLLPSTSPAHAALSVGEKTRIWRSMLGPSLDQQPQEDQR